jgi:hypothetical protein
MRWQLDGDVARCQRGTGPSGPASDCGGGGGDLRWVQVECADEEVIEALG